LITFRIGTPGKRCFVGLSLGIVGVSPGVNWNGTRSKICAGCQWKKLSCRNAKQKILVVHQAGGTKKMTELALYNKLKTVIILNRRTPYLS